MNTNNNNAHTQDVNGILVEVKSKAFDRKWGWVEAWDVYADGIHVARVSGGHYDCTARRSATSHYDEDGKLWFSPNNNNDFRLSFRMTDEIRALILWTATSYHLPKQTRLLSKDEGAYLVRHAE